MIVFLLFTTLPGISSSLYGQQRLNGQGAPVEDKLVPVPNPPLDHLEKAVAVQLGEARQLADSVTGDRGESREKRARVYGELGQLYQAYELNGAAEVCYRNAVVLSPASVEWNYSLGYLLQAVGKYAEALGFLQKSRAGRQDPGLDYLVYIRIGECHRSLNQPYQAKLAFQAAYQVNPLGPAVLARLGEIALEEKHYNEAIEYLSSALEKQPEANKLHYSLGMAYRGIGDMDRARAHMGKYGMVGVQPPDPLKIRLEKLVTGYRVHLLAGKLAFSAGRYNEAVESFQKAIAADAKEVGARINLGTALGRLKKYREALDQFLAAIELAPGNVTAHFNLGMLYSHLGNTKKAIEHLQVVVARNPKDAQAHLTLAGLLREDGRLEKALGHYSVALGIDPGLVWAWVDMSALLSRTGKHARALEVLEDAHARIPHDGPIAHALARLLASSPDMTKRQGKKALELSLKVYQAMPSAEHARTVALSYAELNRCDEAVKWMEKAIELAAKYSHGQAVLENLERNLEYFKSSRPCRAPGER
jgi:tetratricopeptide (TPR) repeat protein